MAKMRSSLTSQPKSNANWGHAKVCRSALGTVLPPLPASRGKVANSTVVNCHAGRPRPVAQHHRRLAFHKCASSV
eukprot:4564313-Alexandrium_andersonii.AAC.1